MYISTVEERCQAHFTSWRKKFSGGGVRRGRRGVGPYAAGAGAYALIAEFKISAYDFRGAVCAN